MGKLQELGSAENTPEANYSIMSLRISDIDVIVHLALSTLLAYGSNMLI